MHSEDEDAPDGYSETHPLQTPERPFLQHLEINQEDGEDDLPKYLRMPRRYLPLPIGRLLSGLSEWSKGPERQIQKVRTVFPQLQQISQLVQDELAIKNYQNASPGAVLLLRGFLTLFSVWLTSTPSVIDGYGTAKPIRCMQPAWFPKDECGLDGVDCETFSNTTTAYQCRSDCASNQVYEPHVVGDKEVTYSSLVIGGAPGTTSDAFCRADSSICQAAIHAGVISNREGGVVLMRLVGAHADFAATFSNGIQSIGFDSTFPKSFVFAPIDKRSNHLWDFRRPMLAVSVLITSIISIFVTSPSILFASTFAMLFVHVGLVSDKPNLPTMAALVSSPTGRFLPAAFVAAIIYKFCVRPQLRELDAPFERTVLWLGAAWFGALENYMLDRLPLRRLTPHDLRTQADAVLTLLIITFVILSIAIGQIYYLRLECRFRRYLKLYACMTGGLTLLALTPSLHLRIHHYILALLFLPGTAIQTRPSLLYQGLLVGLFINGVARWGFDSILQTDDALRGNGGRYNSLLPNVTVSTLEGKSVDFQWALPPPPCDGISVLVNDVERHRWYAGEGERNYTWSRGVGSERKTYFRFGYRVDGHAVDYTSAAVWEIDGRWTPFERV